MLSSVTFTTTTQDGAVGKHVPISITVSYIPPSHEYSSPPVTSYVTVVLPAAPAVDLNGDAPGDGYTTVYATNAGSPDPVISGDLSIDFPATERIDGGEIRLDGAYGTLGVDTSGTNIISILQGGNLILSVVDTVEHYEQVLRSTSLTDINGQEGGTGHVRFTLSDDESGRGPTATSTILLRHVPLSPLDLNGLRLARGIPRHTSSAVLRFHWLIQTIYGLLARCFRSP